MVRGMVHRRGSFPFGQVGSLARAKGRRSFDYFSELLIEVNLLLRLVPRPFTATMIAIEMPAAIRPYSMAVAPDSSLQNFEISFIVLPLSAPEPRAARSSENIT